MHSITPARSLVAVAALGLAGLALALAPTPAARAATVDDCQATIAALGEQTQTVPITGQNAAKDRTGLLGKLDAAVAALSVGKNAGAVQKLQDFAAKVNQLLAAGKINTDPLRGVTGAQLLTGAEDAISCIQSLDTA